jgi:putative membrane protein
MKRLLIAVSAVALVSACSTQQAAVDGPAAAAVDPSSPLAAPMYMQMAASSDLFEIQSGQLAAQMSQNPAVRSFGSLLVAHHTQTTQQLAAAGQAAGLPPPPPALMPNHQAMLGQLQAAGPNFDVAFRDVQVQAHQEALALHQNYASGGDVAQLRTVAAATAPIVQQHLTTAQSLNVMAAPPPMQEQPQQQPSAAPPSGGERG